MATAKSRKQNTKSTAEKSRASKSEVKKATQKGISLFRTALKDLANR